MSKKVKSLILGLTKTQWRKIRRIADVHFIQLTTGAIIYLICPKTTIDPQAMAMIQSLYSRDPATILKHLIEVSEKGAEKFMAQFYVNYGHKSIGDCGNILIAVEGVSMIATKAIQDSQLYAGQEASTRYIDFSNQAFLDPSQGNIVIPIEIGNARNRAQILQENWRAFYMENLPLVQAYVMEQNPFEGFDFTEQLEKNPKTDTRALWKKTMYSRAFDIMRGFLPSGATTCVAWWTSISHAGDHLSWLRCHVLPEVSELALKTEELLKSVYPSSFTRKVDPNREAYKTMWYRDDYFLTKDNRGFNGGNYPREYLFDLHQNLSKHYKKYVLERPAGVELPWQIGEASVIRWTDVIDFG